MLRKEYLYHYNKKWREKNKNYYRPYAREYARRIRKEVIEHYGGKCVCCGESHLEFLCLDHINGNGNKHRKEIGAGANVIFWIRKNNYPIGLFQILCANCNLGKHINGICPHKI